MNKPMTYKGYSARIEYSDEDECFVGRVAGIRDIITFHGKSVQEIKHAFEEAVDFYIESCSARGEAPNKPFTGRFVVRVSPELHSAIAMAAKRNHKSINSWIADICGSHAIAKGDPGKARGRSRAEH